MASEAIGALRWYLELDGITEGYFREITGLDSETEVIEHRVTGRDREERRERGKRVSLLVGPYVEEAVDGDHRDAGRRGSRRRCAAETSTSKRNRPGLLLPTGFDAGAHRGGSGTRARAASGALRRLAAWMSTRGGA